MSKLLMQHCVKIDKQSLFDVACKLKLAFRKLKWLSHI